MAGRAIVLRGDAAHLPLPDGSVDLVVTSPPYFGLRSYRDGGEVYDSQIGSEVTPRDYLEALWACTREWVRVLKPEGSIFVNLGDKYSTYTGANWGNGRSLDGNRGTAKVPHGGPVNAPTVYGIPFKSLMGLPWRYALGCVDQLGLILRAEIVWSKPSAMPESVHDRVKRSHEQVFHLTRQQRYFSALDEIRRPLAAPGRKAGASAFGARDASLPRTATGEYAGQNALGAIPESVWRIPSSPFTAPSELGVDHYAAFPVELARRIILGWSPSGVCSACGEGRRPVPATVGLDMSRPQARRAQQLADRAELTEDHLAALRSVGVSDTGRGAAVQAGTGRNSPEVYALAAEARVELGGYAREYLLRRPTSFAYVCACPGSSAPTRPAVIVDPFGGTGTTALVAAVLGATGITVDRSADYCRLAAWRTTDPAERARALGVPKPPPVPDGQGSLFDDVEAS